MKAKVFIYEMKYQIYLLSSTTLKTDLLFSVTGTSKGYSVAARRPGA